MQNIDLINTEIKQKHKTETQQTTHKHILNTNTAENTHIFIISTETNQKHKSKTSETFVENAKLKSKDRRQIQKTNEYNRNK